MIKEGIPEKMAFKLFHRMKEQQEMFQHTHASLEGLSQGHSVLEELPSGVGKWTVHVGGSPQHQNSRALSVVPLGLPGLGEL